MQQNVAFPANILKFWERGCPTFDAYGVLMSLTKRIPHSKILDPPLE